MPLTFPEFIKVENDWYGRAVELPLNKRKGLLKSINSFTYGNSLTTDHTSIEIIYYGTTKLYLLKTMIMKLVENNIEYNLEIIPNGNNKLSKLTFQLINV
jgi:hypothetical protein